MYTHFRKKSFDKGTVSAELCTAIAMRQVKYRITTIAIARDNNIVATKQYFASVQIFYDGPFDRNNRSDGMYGNLMQRHFVFSFGVDATHRKKKFVLKF